MKPSTPAARTAIEDAIDAAAEAMNALDRATQKLSRIRGGAALYTRAQKLRDETSDFRHWLKGRLLGPGMSLDSEPEPK